MTFVSQRNQFPMPIKVYTLRDHRLRLGFTLMLQRHFMLYIVLSNAKFINVKEIDKSGMLTGNAQYSWNCYSWT